MIYTTSYRIRINDINYGGHLDHTRLAAILHDARVLYLEKCLQYKSEIDIEGAGLILISLSIKLVKQVYCGDHISVEVVSHLVGAKWTIDFTVKLKDHKVAFANNILGFYDYKEECLVRPPRQFKQNLAIFNSSHSSGVMIPGKEKDF